MGEDLKKKKKKKKVEGRLQTENWSMTERKRTKPNVKKKGQRSIKKRPMNKKKLKEENQGKVQQLI